jgi:hypothetical protein
VTEATTPAACTRVLFRTAAALAEAFPDKGAGDTLVASKAIDPKTLPKLAVIMVGGRSRSGPKTDLQPMPDLAETKRSRSRASARPSNIESYPMDSASDPERLVEEAFTLALTQKGYRLLSRSDLRSIAKEQEFQQSGFTEENAVAAGKLMNVTAVLVVRITDFAAEPLQEMATARQVTLSRATLGARLIEVRRGEIVWTHSEWLARDANTAHYAIRVLETVAKGVASFFPAASDSKSTMLFQAARLANLGQLTGAQKAYRAVVKTYPNTNEARTAEAKLRSFATKPD